MPEKTSPLEQIKLSSRLLRGSIDDELRDGSDHFSRDNVQLLKHHGTYQQDDRDARALAKTQGKRHSFLIRTRVPGGRLSSAQLMAELDLCDELATGTLRITSRQSLQLHGVLKTNLKHVLKRINEVQLTTLGACGDVNRNVMCCPAPNASPVHDQLQELAQQLAQHFTPRTTAYREIWLIDPETGDRQSVANDDQPVEDEPLYGRTYLPRKFKIGIGFPDDNCIDIHTHDLGLLALVESDELVGFNLLVGGGMGMTPANKNTFPALGMKFAFVPPDQVIDVAQAIIEVQRDFGNRADRKLARMKYLVRQMGLETFRDKVQQYLGRQLEPARDIDVHDTCDHLGWHQQRDGAWYYGLSIENGRIADHPDCQLKAAIRAICRQLAPGIRLTAYQKLLFTGIADSDRGTLEELLHQHQVPLASELSVVRKWSMACVALPTCGLAITESERALPGVIDALETVLQQLGLTQERLTVRMTGCPNGCVRPYNADIGFVGRAKGRYTVLLGGNILGTRLTFIYQDRVSEADLVPVLAPLLAYFQQGREANESFGDFCSRKGVDDLRAWAESFQSEGNAKDDD